MLIKTATNVDLFRFCVIQHIPRSTSWQLINCYRKWLVSLGPDSTVTRLKALKVGLLSGLVPKQDIWIAIKADGRPKGPFGYLWSKHVSLTQALNIITLFISNIRSTVLTERQWLKFITSALRPLNTSDALLGLRDLPQTLTLFGSIFREEIENAKFSSLHHWTSSPSKKALMPIFSSTGRYTSVIENEVLPADHFAWIQVLEFPAKERAYESIIKHYIDACGGSDNTPYDVSSESNEIFSGSVAVIQERGMKARVIANPLRLHQAVLSKLGSFLFAVVKRLPWDCTFAQEKGLDFGVKALAAGKTVFCHDLSDATNNFPLEFSELLLDSIREILPEHHKLWFQDHAELFSLLARGKWQAPADMPDSLSFFLESDRTFRWSVGQPLGLYPSYPLFALSHGFLIRLLERRLGTYDTFRILGDDVIIIDRRVSDAYLKMLDVLGVPVSKEKSLISNEMGEFAGKIFDKKGPLKVEKWKDFKTSFLDIVRWLGPPGISLVPSRYRKVVSEIAYMPKPLGLGLNPKGLPFYQRIPEHFEEAFIRSEEKTTALPSPEKDREVQASLEVQAAFKGSKARPYFGILYGPGPRRQDEADPLTVDHLNSLWKHYGYIPSQFMSLWETTKIKTLRRTRYSMPDNSCTLGRFGFLYRTRKRYLSQKAKIEKINSG